MTAISIKNIALAIYESSKEKDEKDLDILMKNAVNLINKKRLLGKTDKILSILEKIIDDDTGVIMAKVSSRSKISDKAIDEIKEFIKKKYKIKEVKLTMIENPKLLGGIKMEIKDEILDATLSSKVHKLQDYLIEN